ncbi:MAG: cytochrome P450 [Acidimicrobiia bacterium]|nr:cytochrome P450 [Acidimicrobiia bacterium]MCY4435162.1 cytochrome P450 [bacterium]
MDGGTENFTVDIDHQTPEFIADRHSRYDELRERCPVVFNEHYGGFWMVTDYESVAQVARDNETFAHKYEPDAPDGISYMGICGVPRPSYIPRQGVSEIDGPEHADLRRVLNPLMTINAVESTRPRMEAVSAWFIDEIVESGEADLVLDYATPVPAVLTLEMMGMVSSNWQHYADFFHATSSYEPTDERYLSAIAHQPDMWGELRDFAQFRREHPADDVTTALVSSPLDGRMLSDDEITAIMWNLVAGGLDTTTSLVSWGLHHLGTHPEDRDRLIEAPSLIPAAVEEFLRHYSPSETLTRTATRDVELGGRQIRRGDLVFISWVSANHDPAAFEDADHVRIDRAVNKHLAFGLGGHRCIGSSIARIESELMLRDVLARIGDYEIDIDGFKPYPGNLLMTGVVSMPVMFTPGVRSGAADPFV